MKEEARKRTDLGGRMNIGQAVEPVEEAFNGLTERTDESRKRVTRNQDITPAFFRGVSNSIAQSFLRDSAHTASI